MFFFVGGISTKVKPAGTVEGPCAACGKRGSLQLIHQYLTPHIFFLPTFRFRSAFLATCPHCASVMELRVEKGKEILRNRETELAESDLHIVQNNNRPKCGACGAIVLPGQNFCPNCGTAL